MEKINNVIKSLTAPEDTHALWLNPEDNSLKAFNFRNGWVSIAGSGGGEFPTDYARQGDPGATLSATQAAVNSLSPIADAAEAYNTGKVQLAQNIIDKGVQASASETLPSLASKVAQIAQQPIVWDESEVGDQYAAQLFGGADNATSPLWNLYEVLKNCKNTFLNAAYEHDGNTYNYKALIVCEYYKGYDSLELKGADAYYTCDGDFYTYSSPTHVWHDFDNGKTNRWVCFLYVQAGSSFEIRNTAISPRSMYIGGHIGTIEYFVNGRLTDIVCGVEETDVIDNYVNSNYSQEFGFNSILRNIKHISQAKIPSAGTIYIDGLSAIQSLSGVAISADNATVVEVRGMEEFTGTGNVYLHLNVNKNLIKVSIPTIKKVLGSCNFCRYSAPSGYENLQTIDFRQLQYLSLVGNDRLISFYGNTGQNVSDIIVGAMTTNLNIDRWNPTNVLSDADKKAQLIENIKNHILAKVSDNSESQTPLIFTVSTNMANAIGSENIEWQGETMTLSDAFATKGWTLVGA